MSVLSDLTARVPASLKTRAAAVALVAISQLGVLGYIVVGRVAHLKNGREITLPIIPVDPRDLFKGDYVRLGYTVANLKRDALEGQPPGRGQPAFVTIDQQSDGTWTVIRITARYPDKLTASQAVLRAHHHSGGAWDHWPLSARYGIERNYVPEGKGPALEQLARDKKLAANVALDRNGNAAIKGLSADGKIIYDEPLY